MSAKFMAFENEASTSQQAHYYANDYDEGQDERIEMNVNQYPNYQSHEPYQANNHHSDVSAFGASPYGVVDEEEEENDLTDDLQEKEQKNVGYRKFMHNNAEQFKPIVGGENYSNFVLCLCLSVCVSAVDANVCVCEGVSLGFSLNWPFILQDSFCCWAAVSTLCGAFIMFSICMRNVKQPKCTA